MNIVLLDPSEIGSPLPRSDRRYFHITRVLKKMVGDCIEAGCGDTLGKATITKLCEKEIWLDFIPERKAAPLRPIDLIAGFPRPIQAGRILKDMTSLGVRSIQFALTDLGEKSYAESDFFKAGQYSDFLKQGAEQAGNPLLPTIQTFWSLDRALKEMNEKAWKDERTAKIALHVGIGLPRLGDFQPSCDGIVLAIGSERGWTDREVAILRENRFELRSLGDRILKTETAALAGTSVLLSKLGYI
jgi:RsmE family RNA methyltransferase